jgi:hypothetical protein
VLEAHKQDLGFGLLLKKYTADVAATPQMIDAAARDTIPRVAPMFWSFRLMVGMGMAMLLLFGWSFWASLKGDFQHRPRLLKLACGVAAAVAVLRAGLGGGEYGRQPWTIYGVLPTRLSVSTLSVESLYGSLAGFVGVLLVVEMMLMVRFARQGAAWGRAVTTMKPLTDIGTTHLLRIAAGCCAASCTAQRNNHAGLCKSEGDLVAAGWRIAGRFCHHGWSRYGRGHAAALCRQGRYRTAGGDQHRRPALGWQPGVVHHRWRGHFCRLAAGVCHGVFRLLLGHAAGVVGAVFPPGGL